MGSFNVACGISGIPIKSGRRAGLQLLTKNPEVPSQKLQVKQSAVCTDPFREFRMPSYPMYGIYDSYGRIVEVEPGLGKDTVAQIFNRPVDTVLIDALTDSRWLYSNGSKLNDLYLPKGHRLGEFEATDVAVLVSLGFTRVAKKQDTFAWKDVEVSCDASKCVQTVSFKGVQIGDEKCPGQRDMSNILKFIVDKTGIYPGVADEDVLAVTIANKTTGMFFLPEVFDAAHGVLQKSIFADLDDQALSESWEQAAKHWESSKDPEHGDTTMGHKLQWAENAYWMLSAVSPDLKQNFAEHPFEQVRWFSDMRHVMTSANRFFAPSSYCSEDADPYVTRAILEASLEAIEDMTAQ